MRYVTLGSSPFHISEISFGGMSLGTDEKKGISLIHQAIDLGINFFDTADIYDKGVNETIVGKALAGKRDKTILASKVGNVHRADSKGLDWNPSKEHILSGIEGSLRRLHTDHIDLYQLHGGTIQDNIDESIEAFELLKQQGKIKHYGISSIRPNVIAEYIKRSSIVSIMTQYSLLDQRPEETTLELIGQHHIGILVRGALVQGLLVDKPAAPYLDRTADEVTKASDAIAAISGPERSKAQTAVRFALHHPSVTSVVAGIRTSGQLEELVKASDTPDLTSDEMDLLQQAVKDNFYKDHRI